MQELDVEALKVEKADGYNLVKLLLISGHDSHD